MFKLKVIRFSIYLLLTSTLAFAQRQVVFLNEDWDFSGGSIWAESVEARVSVPHTWNAKDAAQGFEYYRGEGIYTKSYWLSASG